MTRMRGVNMEMIMAKMAATVKTEVEKIFVMAMVLMFSP